MNQGSLVSYKRCMTNQIIENILTRTSIRKYTNEIIPKDLIRTILTAGMAAPTARNRRPYSFVVIDDQKVKDKLVAGNKYSQMIQTSSHTIVVCGDTDVEETMDFIHHDCAAATQNILLAAHSLNLGAVWVGVRQNDERGWDKHVREVLSLPQNIIPITLIPIGYPDQERVATDRYEEDKVSYNIYKK